MTDDFEARLRDDLHRMVDGEEPPPGLRERVAAGIGRGPTHRRWPVLAAAAALVTVAAVGVGLATGDGGSDVGVATDPVGDRDERDGPTTTQAPATTVARDAREAPGDEPEVLDDVVTVPSDPAPPRTTVPTTTAPPACRDSTDPSCGPFRWDPTPANAPLVVEASVAGPVRAGEQFRVDITASDADGTVDFECVLVEHDAPGISIGSCGPVERLDCPDRYGPWTPPPPEPGSGATHATIQIDEPGSHPVEITVSSLSACANVDPYRSSGSTTVTVDVAPAEDPDVGG